VPVCAYVFFRKYTLKYMMIDSRDESFDDESDDNDVNTELCRQRNLSR